MQPLALALAAVLAGGAADLARAGPSLTLNGVPIDGVSNQRFENATVVIDEKGDVHIEAKGYAVREAALSSVGARPADPRAPGADRLARRYFVVAVHSGGSPWDLAIFINSRWIREVKPGDGRVAMEITRYLHPGANAVLLAAVRRGGVEGGSPSGGAALRVVMGEGSGTGDRVTIERPQVEMTRTAADSGDRTGEYVLEAR